VIAEVTSVPYEHEGQPAVLGFARDVTDRMQLEAQLAQSSRLASLGTLSAGIAHEINNPLTALSLALQLFDVRLGRLAERSSSEDVNALVGLLPDLKNGVDRIASIVRDLSVFSRADYESDPVPTDLVAVVEAAERLTAHQIRHRVRVLVTLEELPSVMGHAQRLEQVLVNLLLNASQSMPEGRGENWIKIRTYVAQDGRAAVEIRDNGSGMSPETLRRAFEPFFTTKPPGEGTGLGLAISYGILHRLGGEIRIESEEGLGTTARVLLHPARGAASDVRPASPVRRAPPPRARVFVADDEARLLGTMRMLLAPDHDVTTAIGGEAACATLLDRRNDFDVVLCDLMMADVSGVEVYERLASVRPEFLPRVVLMTAGACSARAREFLATTSIRVLKKPFGWEELEQLLRELAPSREAAHSDEASD
jgi:nitrogen-specific signal transduction histidine kinase/CheY-like chemotaxis protein